MWEFLWKAFDVVCVDEQIFDVIRLDRKPIAIFSTARVLSVVIRGNF